MREPDAGKDPHAQIGNPGDFTEANQNVHRKPQRRPRCSRRITDSISAPGLPGLTRIPSEWENQDELVLVYGNKSVRHGDFRWRSGGVSRSGDELRRLSNVFLQLTKMPKIGQAEIDILKELAR